MKTERGKYYGNLYLKPRRFCRVLWDLFTKLVSYINKPTVSISLSYKCSWFGCRTWNISSFRLPKTYKYGTYNKGNSIIFETNLCEFTLICTHQTILFSARFCLSEFEMRDEISYQRTDSSWKVCTNVDQKYSLVGKKWNFNCPWNYIKSL